MAAASTVAKEILGLEKSFWEAIQKNDPKTARSLSDQDCVLVGAQGVGRISPDALAGMMENAPYTLDRFDLDDRNFEIKTIGDDAAIVAYKVKEELTVEGKPTTLEAYDSSVWVRRKGKWVCAMHTESIAGDPYGRDRRPMS